MAKEIAMRGQGDEYFVDAGAALAIRLSRKYDEIVPKATLKIEGGSQWQDQWHCCEMMIAHTKGEYDDCQWDWKARGRRSRWLAITMGYSPDKNWWWLARTRMVALLQESVWLAIKRPKKIEDSSRQDWWDWRKREIGLRQRLQQKWKMVCKDKINSIIARGSKAHYRVARKKGLQWKGRNKTRGWACSFDGARQWDAPAEIRFGGAAMGCTSWDRGW
jgi:hypothetical protein